MAEVVDVLKGMCDAGVREFTKDDVAHHLTMKWRQFKPGHLSTIVHTRICGIRHIGEKPTGSRGRPLNLYSFEFGSEYIKST
jgi:hypothetical protein